MVRSEASQNPLFPTTGLFIILHVEHASSHYSMSLIHIDIEPPLQVLGSVRSARVRFGQLALLTEPW